MIDYIFQVIAATAFLGLALCLYQINVMKKIVADVLEIHNTVLERHGEQIKTLRESSFPRYTGTPVGEWAEHDAAVSDALAAKVAENARYGKVPQNGAQSRVGVWQDQDMHVMRGKGVRLPDPENAPFFTTSQPEK